jgi:hypothetical protein
MHAHTQIITNLLIQVVQKAIDIINKEMSLSRKWDVVWQAIRARADQGDPGAMIIESLDCKFMCMRVYVFVCVCVHVCSADQGDPGAMIIESLDCKFMCMRVYVCVCVCVCSCVCPYACLKRVYVCVCVCVHVCIRTHA